MIITKQDFPQVLERLRSRDTLSFDSETTGLRPFSGDTVFSIIIAESVDTAYYFNFNPICTDHLLSEQELSGLRNLFSDPKKLWYAHNAMYDCLMLKESMDIEVNGDVFCTQAQGRVEYNEHFQYGLDASLKRIGMHKDDKVKQYIQDHGLKTLIAIPDKKEPYEVLHYERVPLAIISEYALTDARGTFALGERLSHSIASKSPEKEGSKPQLIDVQKNEMALHHAIVRSTRRGLLLDRPYIKKAIEYERERVHGAIREFEAVSGNRYVNHFKTFERVFDSERALFSFGERTKTGKVNPVFDESALRRFSNPLAKEVLKARDAQGKLNFYNAYLFYGDKNGILHPNMVSGGTNTGRFSSNEPNMQNITSEDLMTCKGCGKGYEHITEVCGVCKGIEFDRPEFLVRRSFIPRPDNCFFNPDYLSQEYQMMLDTAKMLYDAYRERMGLPAVGMEYYELLRKIKEEDYDVHQGTADLVGISRTEAKTLNFACIAEGSKVLTDSGLIDIEKVTLDQKVWDGEQFVNHSGVVYQGEKDTYEYEGLRATEDHLVFTEREGAIPFGDFINRRRGGSIVTAEINGKPIRWTNSDIQDISKRGEEIPGGRPILSLLRKNLVNLDRQYFFKKIYSLQMSIKCSFTKSLHKSIALHFEQVLGYVFSLFRQWENNDGKEKLCLQGYTVSHNRDGACSLSFGKLLSQRYSFFGHRQNRQQRTLRDRKSSSSNTIPKSYEPKKMRVYDILNCGPKHRFTVSGYLVHNCLYGAGASKIASQLNISDLAARDLKDRYFKAIPYIPFFITLASRTAQSRGYVKNWLGRYNYMARDWSYKAPNQLIQGGCADVMKVAMVRIDEMLKGTKSHQLLSIHDEDIIEIHYSEVDTIPHKIMEILEDIYPCNYLPLTASAEWSDISLADKRKGFPTWNNHQQLRA